VLLKIGFLLVAGGLFFIESNAQSLNASFMTIPSFENGQLVICVNEPVAFINTTIGDGPLATYSWDFGFGATPPTSSLEGPVLVTYDAVTPGTTATLLVNNNDGSGSSSFSLSIEVIDSPMSELSLSPISTDYTESEENDMLTFVRCNSDSPQPFSFICNYDNSISQSFDWGDGSPDSDESQLVADIIEHSYPVGDFILEHTVTFANGCSDVRLYRIFNGSAPIVTVSGSGQNTCTPSLFEVDIISNNVPIDYTVSYSDVTDILDFSTASDTTLEHIFYDNSCGEQYVISPLLPPIENAYSATLIAANLCSVNGIPTVVTIGPITVSSAPEAMILAAPPGPICQEESVLLTSIGPSGQTVTIDGCNDTTLTHWTVEETSGYSVELGEMGSSNGATGEDYSFGMWSPGSEIISLNFEDPGTYHVWLHVGSGCGEDSISYPVVVNPFGSVSPQSISSTICSGDTVNPITWTSSQPAYIISWLANPEPGLSGVQPALGIGLGPLQSPDDWVIENSTDEPLFIEVTANVSCTSSPPATWLIEVMPEVIPNLEDLQLPVCSGEAWEIEVGTNVDGVVLSWIPDAPLFVGGATPGSGSSLGDVLVNDSDDLQTVVYTLTSPGLLCPMDPIEFEVDVLPVVNIPLLPDLSFCSEDVVELMEYGLPIDGLNWSWSNSNTDVGLPESGSGLLGEFVAGSNQTGSNLTGTITVTATLADCPAETASFDLTLYPDPEADFVVSPNGGVSCINQEGLIVAETTAADPSFDWTGSDLLSADGAEAQVGAAGTYDVVITDGVTGCAAPFQIEVLEAVPIAITNVDFQPPNCIGGSDGWIEVLTDGGSDVEFTWSPSNIAFTDGYANELPSGLYQVTVTNASECSDLIEVELVDFEGLGVELVATIDSECGEANGMLEVMASGGQGDFDYQWSLFENAPLLDGIDAGLYEVEVTDAGGCSITEFFELDCYPLTPIEVSQLLTPNQDGFNDEWVIEYLWMYPDNKVEVFNRWGTQVFEAEPYNNDWRGTWDPVIGSSKLLPTGTYYYLIDTRKKSQKPFRGFIELQHEQR